MSAADELARAAQDYGQAQDNQQAPAPEVIGGAAQAAGARYESDAAAVQR
jgi:hypothetical protein